MKQLPKTIQIVGLEWTIKTCEVESLGKLRCLDRVIEIDNRCDLDRQWQIFIHEVQEVIMIERGFCFESYPDGDISRHFHMTHSEFRSMGKDFADAIKQLL